MRFAGKDGERAAWREHGGEPGAAPILLIHGYAASSVAFDACITALGERFTVFSCDLLGHGDSDSPEGIDPYRPGPAVERVVEVLEAIGEPVLVCGHSLGGALALRTALEHPELVAGCVVINSNAAAGHGTWLDQVRVSMAELAGRVRAEGTDFMRRSRGVYPPANHRVAEATRERLRVDFDRLTPAGVAGTADGLIGYVGAFDRLGELRVPTLVVAGLRDRAFADQVDAFVGAMGAGTVRLVKIEDAGHSPQLETPEEFVAAVFAFANELGL